MNKTQSKDGVFQESENSDNEDDENDVFNFLNDFIN